MGDATAATAAAADRSILGYSSIVDSCDQVLFIQIHIIFITKTASLAEAASSYLYGFKLSRSNDKMVVVYRTRREDNYSAVVSRSLKKGRRSLWHIRRLFFSPHAPFGDLAI